jgi:hypothetical protein
MATVPKKIVQGVQLTATAAQLDSYVVPANTTAKVFEITLYNSHTIPVGVELYFVESGGSAGVTNQVFGYNGSDGLVLAPDETQIYNMEEVLEAGAKIFGKASVASKVTIRISGIHITGT